MGKWAMLWTCGAALAGATLLPLQSHSTEHRFYYDPQGRVIGATAGSAKYKSYQYDSADNRTQFQYQDAITIPTNSQQLLAEQALLRGEMMTSADGQYDLLFQTDGNLVLYDTNGPLWSSNTFLSNAAFLQMQGDGNLVLYDAQHHPLWATGTSGNPGADFVVQTDGNLVIYKNGVPKWSRFSGLL